MKKMKFSLSPETGTLTEKDTKRYLSTVGLATCVLMVAYFVGSNVLHFLLWRFAPSFFEHALLYELVSLLPLYGIAFPLFYLILNRLPRDKVDSIGMGAGGFWGGLCVAISLMLAGSYVSQFVIAFFEQMLHRELINPVSAGSSWWVDLIIVAVVAPILEELVFRKVLCRRLLPLGEGYAIVLSAVIFGLAHGNFFQFFYAFGFGLLMGLIYVKTGRIRYSVLYHMIINGLSGVLMSWAYEWAEPLLGDVEKMEELYTLSQTDPVAAMEIMQPYLIPMSILSAYSVLELACAVLGVVLFVRGRRKIRLTTGLLPPPREGRVANVFCNVGTAAALTVFAAIFVLSLWA